MQNLEKMEHSKENNQILTSTELELLVGDLGETLTDKCHEYGGGIVYVSVMKGGLMFFSDFVS